MKRPGLVGGEIQVIEVPGSQALIDYTVALADRADLVRRRKVDPEIDNMLKITSDGRKASLFNGPPEAGLPRDVRTKVDALVENVWDLYHSVHDARGTQLIFCDLYTPKSSAKNSTDATIPAVTLTDAERVLTEGIYGEIKRRLVAAGMLAHQVEYVHDATTDEKKTALFARVNSGQCRVLIGSTTKMGTGLNVQSRIIAIHHLTAPWRPDWLEQANGRGRRQGNMWDAIHVFAYVTQRSYDSCIWQMLEQKSRFISQIASGTYAGRSADDIGDLILTASMAKAIALGNPAILDKIRLETELTQAERQYRSWSQQADRSRREVANLPGEIAEQETQIAALRSALDDLRTPPESFTVKLREIGGDRWTTFTDLTTAEIHLATLAGNLHRMSSKTHVLVGEYRGMTLSMSRAWGGVELVATHRSSTHQSSATFSASVRSGRSLSGIEYKISAATGHLANLVENVAVLKRRLAVLSDMPPMWSRREQVAQMLTQYHSACQAVAQEGLVDERRYHFGL